jgi:hypothetical protein
VTEGHVAAADNGPRVRLRYERGEPDPSIGDRVLARLTRIAADPRDDDDTRQQGAPRADLGADPCRSRCSGPRATSRSGRRWAGCRSCYSRSCMRPSSSSSGSRATAPGGVSRRGRRRTRSLARLARARTRTRARVPPHRQRGRPNAARPAYVDSGPSDNLSGECVDFRRLEPTLEPESSMSARYPSHTGERANPPQRKIIRCRRAADSVSRHASC